MRILNFGSLNIDYVYGVDHFVRPGETLGSESYRVFPGGKGGNQSLALARAGARVSHAGKLGRDGVFIKEMLETDGVDTTYLDILDEGPSGHAIIQVNRAGENAILLHGGANHCIAGEDGARVLEHFEEGDILLLQNEISAIPELIRQGSERGMKVVFNPAPMHPSVLDYPLELIDLFIVNEIEAAGLSGEDDEDKALECLVERFPRADIVVTRGPRGAVCVCNGRFTSVAAGLAKPVDTTGAGDTFIGYFLAELSTGQPAEAAMRMACRAADICVTRPGAAGSIPRRNEL